MEIVKIRLQLAGNDASLTQVVKDMGIRGLYKGTLATLMRDVPFSIVFFSSHGYLKGKFTKLGEEPSLKTIFMSGMVAGSISAVIVTPMDVIKTKLQVKDSIYKSQLECYRHVYQEKGVRGLFRGAMPRAMIVSVIIIYLALVCDYCAHIRISE